MVTHGEQSRTGESSANLLFRHIFGGQRGLMALTTVERDASNAWDRESIGERFFGFPDELQDACEHARAESERGREVYFGAHLLTAERRVKDNAAEVRALWGDLDAGDVPNGDKTPTAVVQSSPDKCHVYYRLTEPIPPAVAEELNKRLAHDIGADPSGFDLSQLLRVPGTVNHKYPERPEVQVTHLDGTRAYVPGELDQSLGAAPGGSGKERRAGDPAGEPPVVLDEAGMRVWRGEEPKRRDDGEIDRSGTLLKIGRILYDAGANRATAVRGLEERDVALGYLKYSDRRDGEQRYQELVDTLEQAGRNARTRPAAEAKPKPPEIPFPEIDPAAYRGLFGRAVMLVDPHTEGDPVGVLVSMIAAFGNAIGRGPYMQIGASRHHGNLGIGIVGDSSKGRKGSTWDPVENLMHAADQGWTEHRIQTGLSSGEGLINEVRDPIKAPDKEGVVKVVDPGVSDKRLLVMESELSQALKVMKREGNTLSPTLRNAWDGRSLKTMVKHSPLKATDPHVTILGHITRTELGRHLTETELANGLANRFIWIMARRSKSLPFGGEWNKADLAPVVRELSDALGFASRERRLEWSTEARPVWGSLYESLTEDRPGMFGAVTSRAEAQTLRLAMLYALADRSELIEPHHIESAAAVWEYAEDSARYIFGEMVGDPDADKILAALQDAPEGLARNEVREFFGRNKGRDELDRIRDVLQNAERIRVTRAPEGAGTKPVERWHAV